MKNLVIILLLAFTCNINGQEKTCSKFKTGKFKFEDPKYMNWEITRNDSIQIEVNNKTGLKIFNSIVWKTACEYVLTCYKALNTSNPTNFVGKIFYVEITETFADGYHCISKNNAIDDMYLKVLKVK